MAYRIPTSELELPNGINDLRVPVNGVHTNDIFNDRIDLLVENFNYLLDAASIVDNTSPNTYDYAYDFVGDTWTSNPSSLVTTPPSSDHGYNFIEAVDMYNGKFLYICAKSTSIDFFVGGDVSDSDTSPLSLKITYTQIKQSGNQGYKDISYIRYDADKLYVYDAAYQGLVVYDISGLLYGDTIVENILFVRQFSQIKNLIALDFSANIYAITNKELIILNRDLNILSRTTLFTESPLRLLVGNEIYILYSNKIDSYNLNLDYIDSNEFKGISSDNLIDIEDSKVDDDIVYLLTNKYLYRYDIGDNVILNYFKLGYNNDRDFVDVYVKGGVTKDHIFLTDQTKLHFMQDLISYVYVYDRNNLNDRQSVTNIEIKDLELEQDFVFNTSIQRILFNNLLLYNSLIYKAIAVTDDNGFLEYVYKKNLTNPNSINPALIYIGQNEVFSYQVFQRAFKEILDIQTKILNLIEYDYTENSTNTLSV